MTHLFKRLSSPRKPSLFVELAMVLFLSLGAFLHTMSAEHAPGQWVIAVGTGSVAAFSLLLVPLAFMARGRAALQADLTGGRSLAWQKRLSQHRYELPTVRATMVCSFTFSSLILAAMIFTQLLTHDSLWSLVYLLPVVVASTFTRLEGLAVAFAAAFATALIVAAISIGSTWGTSLDLRLIAQWCSTYFALGLAVVMLVPLPQRWTTRRVA
ncbi:hypothetical protein [Deinococcus multiflagellatus]|uniref:Uncharacterized protein n=1 Tax=Deinococcus multiflagellatus TaxID=1656887 RepID=A0ABW1ZTD6_9DEIO|nr:hypothetical protein [Deinococcus multiflagellatus]MBZ9714520.1 hypothetical protein [Deinococcus multiflagellatus]